MKYVVLEKYRNYERVVDLDDIDILMKVSNKDIDKVREMKFEKIKDEIMKTIEVTIDDIKEAIEKGVIKPAESEDEWKRNLEEKGYKNVDIIIKHVNRHRKRNKFHISKKEIEEIGKALTEVDTLIKKHDVRR